VRALHQPDRLVRDDGRAGDVRIDAPQLTHEPFGAITVPDVDGGMDLQQELSAIADELALDLRRYVGEADRARREIALQALERRHEIAIDLPLEQRQRRLAH